MLDDAVSFKHITEVLVGEQLHLLGGHHNVADEATATLIDTAGLGLALGVVSEDETIAEDAGGVVVVLHILWGFDYITKIVIFSLPLAVLALGLEEVFDEGAVEEVAVDEGESGNHNVWGFGYSTKITLFPYTPPLVAQPGQPNAGLHIQHKAYQRFLRPTATNTPFLIFVFEVKGCQVFRVAEHRVLLLEIVGIFNPDDFDAPCLLIVVSFSTEPNTASNKREKAIRDTYDLCLTLLFFLVHGFVDELRHLVAYSEFHISFFLQI